MSLTLWDDGDLVYTKLAQCSGWISSQWIRFLRQTTALLGLIGLYLSLIARVLFVFCFGGELPVRHLHLQPTSQGEPGPDPDDSQQAQIRPVPACGCVRACMCVCMCACVGLQWAGRREEMREKGAKS